MHHKFTCKDCVVKGFFPMKQVTICVVKNDTMHMGSYFFPSFSSLDRQCGFCPALVTPDPKTNHVYAYATDQQKDFELYLHRTKDRHGGLCECVACIRWATSKNDVQDTDDDDDLDDL